MEPNSISRNWNGSGIENLKISGIGMLLELKIQNFSITTVRPNFKRPYVKRPILFD